MKEEGKRKKKIAPPKKKTGSATYQQIQRKSLIVVFYIKEGNWVYESKGEIWALQQGVTVFFKVFFIFWQFHKKQLTVNSVVGYAVCK